MEIDPLIPVFVLCSFASVAFLFLATWGVIREVRNEGRGNPSPPGRGSVIGLALSAGIFFALVALIGLAWIVGRNGGWWRIIVLIVIKLIVQPFCLLLLAGGGYQLWNGLQGRLTYTFRIIPREAIAEGRYRELVKDQVLGAVSLILCAGSLSVACLWPLFSQDSQQERYAPVGGRGEDTILIGSSAR